jgi:hypothetical protein
MKDDFCDKRHGGIEQQRLGRRNMPVREASGKIDQNDRDGKQRGERRGPATPFKLSLPNAISNERREERKPRVTTPRTLTTATTNRGGLLRKYG